VVHCCVTTGPCPYCRIERLERVLRRVWQRYKCVQDDLFLEQVIHAELRRLLDNAMRRLAVLQPWADKAVDAAGPCYQKSIEGDWIK
jgi:hypothetical protein